MTRSLLVTLLCLLLHFAANAQGWAPYGSTWTYTYINDGAYPGPVPEYPSTWIADTCTFHDHLCSFLHDSKLVLSGPVAAYADLMFDIVVTYEDKDKVYWYMPEIDTFTVLYDFTKKAGEYWEMKGLREEGDPTGPLCRATIRVLSTGMDTINGIPLKSMVIQGDGYPKPYKVVQHIGSLLQPRPMPMFLCTSIADYIEYAGLRCIDIPGIGFHNFKAARDCNYVTGIKDPVQPAGLTFAPNPCNELVSVNYNGTAAGLLEIYDLTGRLVFAHAISSQEKTCTIATADWTSGVYLYHLRQEGTPIQTGKLFRN